MKRFAIKLFITAIVVTIVLLLIKQKNMTFRQSILKAIYPVVMFFGKLFPSAHAVIVNQQHITPTVSFYSLKAIDNKNDTVDFAQFKGKKVLIANTASDCGYTAQYDELENLYQQYKNNLVVIAFPANDFKEQEKKKDDEIAAFCKKNYGITFLLMQKTVVVKKEEQNEVFSWLSNTTKNGWNNQAPVWNFCKYVVDENGVLTNYFANTVSPLDKKVVDAVK